MTTKKKKVAKKKSAKKTGGKKYNPKPMPNGVLGDYKKAHDITNDWAGYLLTFNNDVHDALEDIVDGIADLIKRVSRLEGTAAQPTAAPSHISDPPDPPFI